MDGQLTSFETVHFNPFTARLKEALGQAVVGSGRLPPEILAMDGMSGRHYRLFVNNLIAMVPDARYLEIGVWQGSTLVSAIHQNPVRAFAIDNWSQYRGPAGAFFTNLGRFKGETAAVSFLDSDFRAVDFATIGRFNVYLFDGPHTAQDHYDGITLALPALDEQFVLIIDDWNWLPVREGTVEAITASGLRLDFTAQIRTTSDDTHPEVGGAASEWHNGYFIAACSKPAAPLLQSESGRPTVLRSSDRDKHAWK